MAFPTTHLTLAEQCRQVVLLTTVSAVSATYACVLATSPLVPQSCPIVVWDVPLKEARGKDAASSTAADTTAATAPSISQQTDGGVGTPTARQLAFSKTMKQVEARMREHRIPRPTADVTHMTQFFYGGVSPKEAEIHPMLQRVDVCNGPRADVSAAVAAGVLSVESAVFVMVLNAQLLGTDTAAALKPYENFLRTVWSVNPHVGAAAASPSTHSTTTAASPLSHARQGGLIVVADEIYRVAAAALVKTIAAEVPTTVSWFVQLAFVHAMDPPALEFGAAEVAVEGLTGLSHGGTLPLLCAANALGVLRHFPVSRSEPATVTPVDVALNAALLGHILLCCGQLPECSDACKTDTSKTEETPVNKGDAAGAATASARPHMASFAVAESHNPAEASLVWGMFGEYLMGYYGRFAQQIHAAFPVADVVTATPLLQFPFNVRDIANFGPEPRCPAYLLEGWRAYQQRQRVTDKFHGASVTRRMQAYVQQLDDTLCSIVDAARAAVSREQRAAAAVALRRRASATSSFAMPPYCLEECNVAAYQHMLRRLTTHYSLMPYHQCVALTAVDWEAYISIIARAALVHLANCVLRRTEDPAAKLHRVTGALTVDIPGIAGVTRAPQSPANVLQADSGAAKSAEPTAATAVVPFNFPEPRRSFTNDLIYHGEARIPPFPSLTRQLLTYATFLHRTALRPSGWRSDMTPGMTPKALTTILAQPHIQQLMTTLAAKDGVAKAEVEAQAKNILLLAGDTLNHPQCRTMGLMVREVFKRIYQRVNVNHGAFERLHRQLQMPRVALVFVPLHRSYIDFLILSFLLAEMQSPLPHIVAGDGFLSMGPIATLMRGSGAFFMRRTFRGDPLYAALFKEYVRQMTLRYRPLEFFIEGTRSRTGKTMAPKIGILKFVCDTFFDPGQQELDDVLFIPVSLSYDELLEAPMYAKELLGVPKPKETLANFFKASSTLKRMHGSIHLRMGDAVSLRSLKEHPQQCPLPYQPKNDMIKAGEAAAAPSVARAGEAEKNSGSSADGIGGSSSRGEGLPLRKLSLLNTTPTLAKSVSHTPPSLPSSVAWHLTYRLQRNIVVTPASMVAALLECFIPYYTTRSSRAEAKKAASVAKETPEAASPAGPSGASPSAREEIGVPLTVMEQGVMWLRGILKERGACLSVEAATWDTDRVVKTGLGHLHCFAHLTNSMSTVSYQQPDNVVTRLGVNISTNQLIHICMDEALVVVVAQAFGTPTTPHHPPTAERATVCGTRAVKTEVLANHTQLLQRLLATEFPNYASSSPVSFASWLECTVSRLQHSRSLSVDATASSSAQASASSREGSATAVYSHGPITSLPVTQYYYFLLQLICPHLEALYVVLIACSTLLQAYPGLPLGAADVVNTTQKVCRSLFEEHTLNYAVTANKETLQHYYESLIALSLLQLGRLPPPPPSPTTSGAKGKTVKPSQGIVVYKAGSLGQGKVLERLDVLASQVQKFLWYPEAEMECAVDACVVKERVLTVYKELTQSSKI